MEKTKKQGKKLLTAVVAAVFLFLLTFIFHTGFGQLLQPDAARGGELTDWKFVCSSTASGIEGNVSGLKQATSANRVSKEFGKKYMRLQYTLPASETEQTLRVATDYNVMKITADGVTVADNGYGSNDYAGSRILTAVVPAGGERTVDIYLYAPLSFSFSAEIAGETGMTGLITGNLFSAFSIAAVLLGAVLMICAIAVSAGSANTGKMLLISLNILFVCVFGLLYSVTGASAAFSAPAWYAAVTILGFLLTALMCLTVLACCGQSLRPMLLALPAAAAGVFLLLVHSALAAAIALAVFAVTELILALLGLKAFSEAGQGLNFGLARGLLLYVALAGLYNGVCMLLGLSPLSAAVKPVAFGVLAVVLFTTYFRQAVYLDIRRDERKNLIHQDTAWVENLAKMISDMFVQTDETEFLRKVAGSMGDIMRRCDSAEAAEPISVCAALSQGENETFTEVCNSGTIENCAYRELADYLEKHDLPYLIGDKSVDLMFYSDNRHRAVVHFEHIIPGVSETMSNVVRAAYGNLFFAFRNLNLRSDMFSMQETMFIQLARMVEQRTVDAEKHQKVVSVLVRELCLELGFDEEQANLISVASLVHDIGKIAIADSILCKNEQLTGDEYEQMKLHVAYGYNILSIQSGGFFDAASKIALQHHENYDGTGYLGLSGENIDMGARIVRVIDVFDALLMNRCYKQPWSREETLKYLSDGAGTLFDPRIVRRFLENSARMLELRNEVYRGEEKA